MRFCVLLDPLWHSGILVVETWQHWELDEKKWFSTCPSIKSYSAGVVQARQKMKTWSCAIYPVVYGKIVGFWKFKMADAVAAILWIVHFFEIFIVFFRAVGNICERWRVWSGYVTWKGKTVGIKKLTIFGVISEIYPKIGKSRNIDIFQLFLTWSYRFSLY